MSTPTTTKNANKFLSKLADARVLIFGGTSGMGFCIAEGALEQGAHVIVSGSGQAKLDNALHRLKTAYPESADRVSGHTCDLSDPATLEANLQALLERVGAPIHHIAYTAGDALELKPVSDASVAYVQKVGVVRFLGPLMLAKLAPPFLAPGPGSSITLTSGTNVAKPAPGWTVLAAWGAGIEGMMRGLAVDLAPVRVNLVSPGAVRTEAFQRFPQDQLEAVLERFREGALTRSLGRPEDLAEAYLYAMKDRFVTGIVIRSDGGRVLV